MNIHKRIQLTPLQRKEIDLEQHRERVRVALQAEEYLVFRSTIDKIPSRGHKCDCSVHNGCSPCSACLHWEWLSPTSSGSFTLLLCPMGRRVSPHVFQKRCWGNGPVR